jgi:SAM-dependent methyltransferase
MNSSGFGAIPVARDDGSLAGVLNAWDVVRILAAGRDVFTTEAGSVVGGEMTLAPDDDVAEAERKLQLSGGPLLPVVSRGGRLAGTVSMSDLQASLAAANKLGANVPLLKTDISPNDGMFASGQTGPYLLAGISALNCIRTGLAFNKAAEPQTILDLPCGHGRVLRFLCAAFPAAAIVACDLDRDGVDFCAGTFGVTPVYSEVDPDDIPIESAFDVIWVGSLFTHLDPERWPRFLQFFADHLSRAGTLVFTTGQLLPAQRLRDHGIKDEQALARITADYHEGGFCFYELEGHVNYGMTFAAPAWVNRQIDTTAGLRHVDYLDHGWFPPYPGQDAWICGRAG